MKVSSPSLLRGDELTLPAIEVSGGGGGAILRGVTSLVSCLLVNCCGKRRELASSHFSLQINELLTRWRPSCTAASEQEHSLWVTFSALIWSMECAS